MTRIICLRDDDTSFHTKYEELAEGYGEFWGKIPVTLATVPFSHGSQQKILEYEQIKGNKFEHVRKWEKNASFELLTEYHKLHPIGENKDLVEKLKPFVKEKKVEIAQHGISHRYNEKGAEMYYDNVGLLQIRDGKEYLEKVFETEVNVFVPPSNTIDPRCGKYINKIGMDILCSGSIRFRSLKEQILNLMYYPMDVFRFFKRKVIGKNPAIYSRCGIDFTGAPTFDAWKTVDEMYEKVIDGLNRNNAVAITTHYMLLNNLMSDNYEYRRKYQEFLARLSDLKDVEFVTATEYIRRLKNRG